MRPFVVLLTMTFVLSGEVWAQHQGHTHGAAPPGDQTQTAGQDSRHPSILDAIKSSQSLFRELEKAARPWDEARFTEVSTRYELSIDELMRSVDETAVDERNHLKNLELAQITLGRHREQLQQLASSIPGPASHSVTHLIDVVTISRDTVLAQQKALNDGAVSNHAAGSHQGGTRHGCGSRRLGLGALFGHR